MSDQAGVTSRKEPAAPQPLCVVLALACWCCEEPADLDGIAACKCSIFAAEPGSMECANCWLQEKGRDR